MGGRTSKHAWLDYVNPGPRHAMTLTCPHYPVPLMWCQSLLAKAVGGRGMTPFQKDIEATACHSPSLVFLSRAARGVIPPVTHHPETLRNLPFPTYLLPETHLCSRASQTHYSLLSCSKGLHGWC